VTAPPTFPLADADLCVKCGLCLPHCPTYQETRHEADSPRGRIALMQGLVTNALPITPAAEAHLDGCLGCRACETVCPAHVPYGELIDAGRGWLAHQRPQRTRTARRIGDVLANGPLRTAFGVLLWLYQRFGFSALLRSIPGFRTSRIGRLESLLPPIAFPRALRTSATARNDARQHVQLFTGCTGVLADRDAAIATVRLLEAAGYSVEIPAAQQCCGALHLHAGLPAPAAHLLDRNIAAFRGDAPIVSLASGCASGLRDACLQAGDAGTAFAARIADPWALLLRADELRFAPLAARVAVQMPCTQRLVPGSGAALLALLRRIPQLEVIEVKPSRNCCGAAGSYFLTEAGMADRLLDAALSGIKQAQPTIFTSANIGCRLHIAAGLRRRGSDIEILHPATLLARQLIRPAVPGTVSG
jgi:glycolate oxidase iron-sulfur subunit